MTTADSSSPIESADARCTASSERRLGHCAGFIDEDGSLQGNDLTYVTNEPDINADPIDVGVFGELPSLGQFDPLATAKGSPSQRMVEIVGYGLVGTIPAPHIFDVETWERYVGYSTVINSGKSANAGPQNFVFTNSPGKGNGVGGTCSGDSGGPAFWIDPATGEPTNIVLAVNSYGIAPLCNGNDYQFRTDTAAALDFIYTYFTP